jgi:hypothetical protein
MRALALASVLPALVAATREAKAGCTAGSTHCVCYDSTPTWNVPAGSAVQMHTDSGHLSGMFAAIGEYRTHTMFAISPYASGGPGSVPSSTWMLHTDANPVPADLSDAAQNICKNPIRLASMDQPGTTATPDVFQYLFGGASKVVAGTAAGSTFNAQPQFLSYTPPLQADYGNGFEWGMPAGTDFGIAFSTVAWKLLGPVGSWQMAPNLPDRESVAYQAFWNGKPMKYSFHSFIDGNGPSVGQLDSTNGMFCASTGAFVQTNLFAPPAPPGGISLNFYPGGFPETKVYSNAVIFGGTAAQQQTTENVTAKESSTAPSVADNSAAWNLWEDIYATCASAGWKKSALQVACVLPPFVGPISSGNWDVCESAANEVINYVATGDNQNPHFDWENLIGNQSFFASSITDDTLTGWTNGPTNFRTGIIEYYNGMPYPQWQITPGASVWANGLYYDVQWNAAGPAIDCEVDDSAPGDTPTKDTNPFKAGN